MIIVKGDNFKKLHFAKGENNSIFIRYHLLPIYIVQGECLMTKVNTKEGTIPTIQLYHLSEKNYHCQRVKRNTCVSSQKLFHTFFPVAYIMCCQNIDKCSQILCFFVVYYEQTTD